MTLDGESAVGRRVECDGHRGTVRYDGEIEGAGAGRWLGVEWDDPSRGKHDGVHQGRKYFDTKCALAGSFVRPHKVNLGRSCAEALLEQYESSFEAQLTSFRTGSSGMVKTAEFVGFEKHLQKISNHNALRIVVLSNLCIRHGDRRLSELCPNVEELDLSKNLLSNVADVASVVEHLPRLKTLLISHNLFSSWAGRKEVFDQIQNLVAASMELTALDEIADLFANLVTLKVPQNKICSLSQLNFPLLRELDLDGNQIESWDAVQKLSALPNLQILHLNNNRIGSIPDLPSSVFPKLGTLYLSGNLLSDWRSVSALEFLPSLEELIFKDNPLLNAESPETNRQIIICRLARLKTLDKVSVSASEKRGASFDYLKKYGKEYLACRSNPQDLNLFYAKHPCYQKLVEVHGAPEESELSGQKKNLLINVMIECPQLKENGHVEKKLPRTMKLQRLRGMLPKLLPSAPNMLKLSYICRDKPEIKYEFDNDLKDLAFYSIQDNDSIVVEW
ncbi:tubulin-specific chaperone E-like [Neocloeon triangulifer]|uniref:tubulin-specific chaperone E-like n=1 Tax=Neocloeon triangulifer TaxID=2078957 RepID=UPI00286F40E1|nr:tubulin-specific chaperone E-like [Neocloeon triangulifer]